MPVFSNGVAGSVESAEVTESRTRLAFLADTNLVARARAGDALAFERLMMQHQQQVLRTAGYILGRPEDARDVAQEVFLALYRNLVRIRDEAHLRPWLYKVTVNACRDFAKKRRRLPTSLLDGEAAEVPARESNIDDNLDEERRRRLVQSALKELPAKERAALVLRDIEGLSSEQAARVLGSSAATVRSQVASARIKIRRFCERAMRGLK